MFYLENVSYSYPYASKPALQGVSLQIDAGQLVFCTGASGCGKSTLLRILNGLIPHYLKGNLQGRVEVAGRSGQNAAKIAEQVGSLFQDPERQFFALTVQDEIAFALQWRNWQPKAIALAVEESAERLGIKHLLKEHIFALSEGQKQKVALASLLAAKPKALLLDEPSANLDPEGAMDLAKTLTDLKNQGLAILVVDHRLAWIAKSVDLAIVLNEGQVCARGSFNIFDDEAFCQKNGLRSPKFVDSRHSLPVQAKQACESIFGCKDISFGYKKGRNVFENLSLDFYPQEIVALIGKNGVGKTSLARVLTGLEAHRTGFIHTAQQKINRKKLPLYAQVVLQNAGHQLRMHTVFAELDDAARQIIKDKQQREQRINEILALYGLETLAERHPQSLSGGEKQRLAVACAFIRQPKILILDEPTSGLDGRNMQRMAKSIEIAANEGAAVIIITHDLELMNHVCLYKIELAG